MNKEIGGGELMYIWQIIQNNTNQKYQSWGSN